ncbi:uncharacterized protein P884DRAFT_281253 [Thermothelomyces heterothallicus CBS 202.75]|uniref:uncharacterized protein n=1 Tax=Thermothelomyces heterothallicus CBS 202.75 TaxID=1149848 RepID=UPI003744999A
MSQFGAEPRAAGSGAQITLDSATGDATTTSHTSSLAGNSTNRDHVVAIGSGDDSRPAGDATQSSSENHRPGENNQPPQPRNQHPLALSRSNSQGTTSSTNGADAVFTPPTSGGRPSPGTGSAHGSSQDSQSQLHQLSQIAAAQARIPEDAADLGPGVSRKRMADGMVKHSRDKSNVSPGQMAGHSRNTSAVSVSSTAGSRIGELSAELRARLSYAMVKVNHGWQSHSIDQVETLASQAASPVSSASTIHLRNGSSASPQPPAVSHRAMDNATPAAGTQHPHSGLAAESRSSTSPQSTSRGSSTSPVKTSHGLAPPVSIQPSQPAGNPRRDSNPRQAPPPLSGSSYHTSPRTGGQHASSAYLAPGRHRSAISDAMLVSPHTNVREQDAIESLLFMSSPGNSANLKHAFPTTSSSQPLPSSHAPPQQRTALPTSQPRKSLPSGRPPTHHSRSQSQSQSQAQAAKRVGFDKSPSAMDVDDPPSAGGGGGSPMSVSRGTPRRRANGDHYYHNSAQAQAQAQAAPPPTPRSRQQIPVSVGLTVSSKPRRPLADDEIDRMLDQAAADDADSDSDGEIELPPAASVRVPRRGGDGAEVINV